MTGGSIGGGHGKTPKKKEEIFPNEEKMPLEPKLARTGEELMHVRSVEAQSPHVHMVGKFEESGASSLSSDVLFASS
ncbi:hypothetical protein TNCV_2411531 [Trichonephila clavipes]|nr:hypothetical protein TNCV_2411531 [Trichonephila clavipes]